MVLKKEQERAVYFPGLMDCLWNIIHDTDRCSSEGRLASRLHLQWLLAKLGQKVGCDVWMTPSDRAQMWQNERLGDFCVESLPPLTLPLGQQELAGVDLLWFHKTELVAAYRIAQTSPRDGAVLAASLRSVALTAQA